MGQTRDGPPSATVRETARSANFEGPEHALSERRVLEEAIEAVDQCGCGGHVTRIHVLE